MKNEKGLTLVELMGLLVIIALILIVTVPSITETLKGAKDKNLKAYEDTICEAAITYADLEREDSENTQRSDLQKLFRKRGSESAVTITVEDILAEGYLANNTKHPDKGTNAGVEVTVQNNGSEIECVGYTGL